MSPTGKFSANWKQAAISSGATLREALAAINSSGTLMACVASEAGELLALLSDSDIRRALLNGANLQDRALDWANHAPITGTASMSESELRELARTTGVRELPIVDIEGKLSDIFLLSYREHRVEVPTIPNVLAVGANLIANEMFIPAGGKGSRLRSVVSDRPKALALVGDKPMLETLITRGVQSGIRRFTISVNYMSQLIEDHLRLPLYSQLDINIVKEDKYLGTAGSLCFVKNKVSEPLLVCNSDVLTRAPFHAILNFHQMERAQISCVVMPFQVKIPYGVVNIEGNQIRSFSEKPEFTHYVNAGMYVLSPEVLALVEENVFLDMPDLMNRIIGQGGKVAPFLLHEYWIDIGHPEDYKRANSEFEMQFGGLNG